MTATFESFRFSCFFRSLQEKPDCRMWEMAEFCSRNRGHRETCYFLMPGAGGPCWALADFKRPNQVVTEFCDVPCGLAARWLLPPAARMQSSPRRAPRMRAAHAAIVTPMGGVIHSLSLPEPGGVGTLPAPRLVPPLLFFALPPPRLPVRPRLPRCVTAPMRQQYAVPHHSRCMPTPPHPVGAAAGGRGV